MFVCVRSPKTWNAGPRVWTNRKRTSKAAFSPSVKRRGEKRPLQTPVSLSSRRRYVLLCWAEQNGCFEHITHVSVAFQTGALERLVTEASKATEEESSSSKVKNSYLFFYVHVNKWKMKADCLNESSVTSVFVMCDAVVGRVGYSQTLVVI